MMRGERRTRRTRRAKRERKIEQKDMMNEWLTDDEWMRIGGAAKRRKEGSKEGRKECQRTDGRAEDGDAFTLARRKCCSTFCLGCSSHLP